MAKRSVSGDIEQKIRDAARIIRGHIPAAEYRSFITGIVILRCLSFIDTDIYVPDTARWEYITSDPDMIGDMLDSAVVAAESAVPELLGLLPHNYSDETLDKSVLWEVVSLFDDLEPCTGENGYDILGKMYEKCITGFAALEGKKGGEYFTPETLSRLIIEILQPTGNCTVYDPCCGAGGMLIQAIKYLKEHNEDTSGVLLCGQEISADTWRSARLNMALHGLEADLGKKNADTFTSDLHDSLKADIIVADPPFNMNYWGQEKLIDDVRWSYGLPSKANANYAWLQHCIYHLSDTGRMGLVISNGTCGDKILGAGEIRRKMIEDDLVEGIIAMPANLYYNIPFPVTIWIINKYKNQIGKTLFIDASDMGTKVVRGHRELTEDDFSKITDTFERFRRGEFISEKGFSGVASLTEIAANDHTLNVGNYIERETNVISDNEFLTQIRSLADEWKELSERSAEIDKKILQSYSDIEALFGEKK